VARPRGVELSRISAGSATASKMARICATRSSAVIPGQSWLEGTGVGISKVMSLPTTGEPVKVMGPGIGALVGASVGASVGVSVGASVKGAAEGATVVGGAKVGTLVGLSDGWSLGTAVRLILIEASVVAAKAAKTSSMASSSSWASSPLTCASVVTIGRKERSPKTEESGRLLRGRDFRSIWPFAKLAVLATAR